MKSCSLPVSPKMLNVDVKTALAQAQQAVCEAARLMKPLVAGITLGSKSIGGTELEEHHGCTLELFDGKGRIDGKTIRGKF